LQLAGKARKLCSSPFASHPKAPERQAMKEIEILPNGSGAPEVTLHGDAKACGGGEGSFYDPSIFEPFRCKFRLSLAGGIVLS
jgi:hypothetical protein